MRFGTGVRGAACRDAFFACLFAVAVVAGRATRVDGSEISLVWPAAAVAAVWMLTARAGTKAAWSALVLAGVAFAATWATGVDVDLSLGFAVVNVLIGCATAYLLRSRGPLRLAEPPDLAWLLACVGVATGAAAVLGGVVLHQHDGSPVWQSAAVFWLRNGVTVFLGVTLLATAGPWPRVRAVPGGRLAGDVGVWAFAVLVYAVVFVVNDGYPVAYFVLPVGVLMALRWSTTVAVWHVLASDVFMVLATVAGRGPFSGADPLLRAALAQGLAGCVLVIVLTVALFRDSRQRVLAQLVAAHGEAQAAASQLRHASLHDPLTGLANRARLAEVLTEELGAPGADGRRVGVVFLDLDGFKLVNDTWGHAEGDQVLRAVARRLAAHSRTEDSVARLGGDEFVMVCRVGSLEELELVALRVAADLARPHHTGSGAEAHTVSASTGVAWAEGATTAAELVRDADAAMYRAKRQRRLQGTA